MRSSDAWRTSATSAAVPLLVSVLLVAGVLAWMAALIRNDLLTNTDELNTAERSREMWLLGRGTVHDDFQISVAKPPLQYWLTSFTLPRFENREMAVRIWPLIYGGLTAIALSCLAALVSPNRWLIPLSNLFLFSCPIFLTEAARATLDSGLVFFTTLAILFAQLARRNPRWWMAVAIVCWLGALQKNPLILAIWLMILLIRAWSDHSTLRSRWVIGSLLLAGLLLLVWPLSQRLIYNQSIRDISRLAELVELVGPNRLGTRPYFEIPIRLLDTWPCGFLALLLPFALCFARGKERITPVIELALVSFVTIGLAVLCNLRSVRYVLPIVPCLCLLFGLCLLWMWQTQRARYRVVCLLVFFVSLTGLKMTHYMVDHRRGLGIILSMKGLPGTPGMIERRKRDAADQKALADKLGALSNQKAHIVIVDAYRKLLPPHFYLFYGNLRMPVASYTIDHPPDIIERGPAIGVCATSDLPVVHEKYPNATARFTSGSFICWEATQ